MVISSPSNCSHQAIANIIAADEEKAKSDTGSDINIQVDDGLPRKPLHYANYYWHGITHRQFEIRPSVIDDDEPVIVRTPLQPIVEVEEEEDRQENEALVDVENMVQLPQSDAE